MHLREGVLVRGVALRRSAIPLAVTNAGGGVPENVTSLKGPVHKKGSLLPVI